MTDDRDIAVRYLRSIARPTALSSMRSALLRADLERMSRLGGLDIEVEGMRGLFALAICWKPEADEQKPDQDAAVKGLEHTRMALDLADEHGFLPTRKQLNGRMDTLHAKMVRMQFADGCQQSDIGKLLDRIEALEKGRLEP